MPLPRPCVLGALTHVPLPSQLPEDSWPPPSEGLFAAGFVPVEVRQQD